MSEFVCFFIIDLEYGYEKGGFKCDFLLRYK